MKAPTGWYDFSVDILNPEDGKYLFTELLERRGKYINQMSKVEIPALKLFLRKWKIIR